jgi:hypothetical protein
MGYVYRGVKNQGRYEQLYQKLEQYSDTVKRRRAKKPAATTADGLPAARTPVAAKARARARAVAAAAARAESAATVEPADWEKYADNPECWGGAFGLWLATQEANAWRR